MTVTIQEFQKRFGIVEGKLALEKETGKIFVPIVLDHPEGHIQLIEVDHFEKNKEKLSKRLDEFLSKIAPKET